MKNLTPKDHAEAVATFRHAVIGPLCARELSHGELAEMMREIASTRVRPPGSKLTKTYSVPTLERWLYAFDGHVTEIHFAAIYGSTAVHPSRSSCHVQPVDEVVREPVASLFCRRAEAVSRAAKPAKRTLYTVEHAATMRPLVHDLTAGGSLLGDR